MILEEVMNISSNNTINISEANVSLDDYLDLVCEQCNNILLEININNYKVTKEDLLNPDKLKQVLDKVEKDITEPNKKIKVLSYILNGIIILIGTFVTITMGITGPNAFISSGMLIKRNSIITRIISVIVTIFTTNSLIIKQTTCSEFKKIIKTADKSIKKLEKSLEKEDDPKKKKIIKNEINELEKVKKKINDEYTKVQSKIKK